ncbi:hypothetical protein CDAR_30561 [Caerostris darwini]|uniref:Uncharacterized protein n=1 Tax=Caerostris darwini TaxID=1538125 RepID=A0AAV4U4J9_9ARAC|nr:hypothetical protein CDAR_30561 [Caerostris darwini]
MTRRSLRSFCSVESDLTVEGGEKGGGVGGEKEPLRGLNCAFSRFIAFLSFVADIKRGVWIQQHVARQPRCFSVLMQAAILSLAIRKEILIFY